MTHTTAAPGAEAGLAALRDEIDAIDLALHRGLIARGTIIDRLIAAKAAAGGGGSAFRPAREAAMMRALVERHAGILPLDTVEGIWRIIISTFTYVQAAYTVHADVGGGDPAMRDSARFHFGFTVPLATHRDAAAVLAAVAAAPGDLGLLRAGDAASPWWDALRDPAAPKIIARLPFVERDDHAAGLPLFVVARPLAAAAPPDVRLHAVTLPRERARPAGTVAAAPAPGGDVGYLVATAGPMGAAGLAAAVVVGSHAARFELARAAGASETGPSSHP